MKRLTLSLAVLFACSLPETKAAEPALLVRVRQIKVDRKAIGKLGIDASTLLADAGSAKPGSETKPLDSKIINELLAAKAAHVLSDQQSCTVPGQSFSIRSGGEVLMPKGERDKQDYQFVGARIEGVAHVTDKGRIRLKCSGCFSVLDENLKKTVDGRDYPGVRSTTFDTVIEIDSGETIFVRGASAKQHPGEESSTQEADHEALELCEITASRRRSMTSCGCEST
jgi:Flp pilus assembly secretin CpaC